jgi:hypothetical protein
MLNQNISLDNFYNMGIIPLNVRKFFTQRRINGMEEFMSVPEAFSPISM